MEQVKNHFERFDQENDSKKYIITLKTLIVTILVLIIVFALSNGHLLLTNLTGVLIMMLCMMYTHTSAMYIKRVYKYFEGTLNPPVSVPKPFGYGRCINPYSNPGKRMIPIILVCTDAAFISCAIFILFSK